MPKSWQVKGVIRVTMGQRRRHEGSCSEMQSEGDTHTKVLEMQHLGEVLPL